MGGKRPAAGQWRVCNIIRGKGVQAVSPHACAPVGVSRVSQEMPPPRVAWRNIN